MSDKYLVREIEGVAYASHGDTVMVVYKGPSRARPLRALYGAIDELLTKQPDIVVLQFVLRTSTPPDAEARAVNATALNRVKSKLRRVVTIALGDDLWIGIVRTVMRAMSAMSGLSGVHFVERDFARGSAKLLELAGPRTPSPAEIREMAVTLHRALGVEMP